MDAPMSDLETLFQRYRDRVYRWAYALCGRHPDAADVCQEVFLRALVRRPTFQNEGASLGWLRRVTSTIAIDRWRSRRAGPKTTSIDENREIGTAFESGLERRETAQRVRQAIERLSEQQRLVVIAKIFDERTFAEIADELGIAVPTAKTHFVRAIESIRRELDVAPSAPVDARTAGGDL